MKIIRDDVSVLIPYGLETDDMDVGIEEDVALLAELLMIHLTMEQVNIIMITTTATFNDIHTSS